MSPQIIRVIEMAAMDTLRLYFALLTAPYHIGKAFVMRPSGEPFLWTWENRLQSCAGSESGETESAR